MIPFSLYSVGILVLNTLNTLSLNTLCFQLLTRTTFLFLAFPNFPFLCLFLQKKCLFLNIFSINLILLKHFNITVSVLWLPNQFRKHCRFKQQPLRGRRYSILSKGVESYMGGVDNPLETMLYYLTLISLWVAIYTFPIT